MNVHEYQAKTLLAKYGLPVPKGQVAGTPAEAAAAFTALGVPLAVVKAQIHAGGRGKGGGIKVVKSAADAQAAAAGMLGKPLVTHQTGPQGRIVNRVWVEEGSTVERELYLGMVIDRKSNCPVMMASPAGGMDIEEVAATTPEKIRREAVSIGIGLQAFQIRNIVAHLGLEKSQAKAAGQFFTGLAKLFVELDCSLAEINPLAIVAGRGLVALDAKLNFDDRGLDRHPDIAAMRDVNEEDPRELEAAKYDLSYVSMDGNIGCMVNGAGLAMSTMDMLKLHGGAAANFLDVGGGASKDRVAQAFKLILANPSVKAILVNIFGGIVKCDMLAEGIVAAAREVKLDRPLVVRLEGTNVERGREILSHSGLTIISATGMKDAAQKAVAAVAGK